MRTAQNSLSKVRGRLTDTLVEIETDRLDRTGRKERYVGGAYLSWLRERAYFSLSLFLPHVPINRRTPHSRCQDSFFLHCPFSIGVFGQSKRPSINFPQITIMHTYILTSHILVRSARRPTLDICFIPKSFIPPFPLRPQLSLCYCCSSVRHCTLTSNPCSCNSFPWPASLRCRQSICLAYWVGWARSRESFDNGKYKIKGKRLASSKRGACGGKGVWIESVHVPVGRCFESTTRCSASSSAGVPYIISFSAKKRHRS